MIAAETVARFMAKTIPEPNTGCLLWTAFATKDGYGRQMVRGSVYLAHRLAWEIARGPIPCGLQVLHRCDTPACVNADHLFLGTHEDNIRDAVAKGRNRSPRAQAERAMTHCRRGHPFDVENTRVSNGKRCCRACARIRDVRNYHRRKEAADKRAEAQNSGRWR